MEKTELAYEQFKCDDVDYLVNAIRRRRWLWLWRALLVVSAAPIAGIIWHLIHG